MLSPCSSGQEPQKSQYYLPLLLILIIFFLPSPSCSACYVDHCVKCSSSLRCQTCETGYQLSSLLKLCDTCVDGYGLNSKDLCVKCKDSNCKQCQQNYAVCTFCAVDPENRGYGVMTVSSSSATCRLCYDPYCYNCATSYTYCNNCAWGTRGTSDHKKCQNCTVARCGRCPSYKNNCTICEDGFYPVSGTICKPCNVTNCTRCRYSINGCELCSYGGPNLTYFYLSNIYSAYGFSCIPCNLTNCVSCQDNAYTCNQCSDGYGVYFGGGKVCVPCYQTSCQKCSKHFRFCTQCGNSTRLNAQKGLCLSCTDSNCLDCSQNVGICVECLAPYGLSSSSCRNCIDNCITCETTNYQNCSQCTAQKFYINQNNTCSGCQNLCIYCTDANDCYLCENETFLKNSTVDGFNYTQSCISCPQHCTECEQDIDEVFNCIECVGQFVLMSNVSGGPQILCYQVCGDQTTFTYECDMELGIAHDGCTDRCQVQDDFNCTFQENVTGSTHCSYVGNFTATKLVGNIVPYLNEIQLELAIQPNLDVFYDTNLSNCFITNKPQIMQIASVQKKTKYNKSRLLLSSSGEVQRFDGKLLMTMRLFSDIKQTDISIIFSPQSSSDIRFLNSHDASVSLDLSDVFFYSDLMLVLSRAIQISSYFVITFMCILIVLSFVGKKWIGIQITIMIQIFWICILNSRDLLFLPQYALYPLKLASFFNMPFPFSKIFQWKLKKYSPTGPHYSAFQISTQNLFLNHNLFAIVQFILLLCIVATFIYYKRVKIQYEKAVLGDDGEFELAMKCKLKQTQDKKSYFYRFFLICGLLNLNNFTLNLFIYFSNYSSFSSNISLLVAICALLLVYFVNLVLFCFDADPFDWIRYSLKQQKIAMNHFLYYFFAIVLTVLLIMLLPNEQYYSLLPFSIIFLYTIIYRPFRDTKSNILSFLNLCVCLMCLSYSLLQHFYRQQMHNTIFLYTYLLGCVGLILILQIIATIVMIYHIYYIHFIQPYLQKTEKEIVMTELENIKIKEKMKNVAFGQTPNQVYRKLLTSGQNLLDLSHLMSQQNYNNFLTPKSKPVDFYKYVNREGNGLQNFQTVKKQNPKFQAERLINGTRHSSQQSELDYEKLNYNVNKLAGQETNRQLIDEPKVKRQSNNNAENIVTRENYKQYIMNQQNENRINSLSKEQAFEAKKKAFAYDVLANQNAFIRLKNADNYADEKIRPPEVKNVQQCLKAYEEIQQ